MLRFPTALKLEQFSKQRFELVEYRLTEGNPLTGLQLSDLYSNMRVKMLICAVARGKQITIPTGSFTLEEGDTDLPDGHPAATANSSSAVWVFSRSAPTRSWWWALPAWRIISSKN